MGSIYHKHVKFEDMHDSAELQGRRLRITRLSHDTSHPRLIFIREVISALKELRSLSDSTLILSLMKMSRGCDVSWLNRVLRRGELQNPIPKDHVNTTCKIT